MGCADFAMVTICCAVLSNAPAQDSPVITGSSEILEFTGFLVMKRVDSGLTCPDFCFDPEDVRTFASTTGIHRVLWQGNDSLHLIELVDGEGGEKYRYTFKFTLSPPARPDFGSVEELFGGRRVTQYYVWRVAEDGGTAEVEDMVIRSDTDPLASD
ncbi:hypothetical protein GF402_08345 [Candidatus Fermentibacteria bacterium]|nr:hypothetical protein [Candidatus Fermentibacteria bacterium]